MVAATQSSETEPDHDQLLVGATVSRLPMTPEGQHDIHRQHYAELDFADRRPIPAPPHDMFVVAYAEVGQA